MLLLLLAVHGWACALIFVRMLKPRPQAESKKSNWPRVAVLMGLKGSDPDLLDGLKRLIGQDYPEFELRIVVDSSTDPAWQTVQRAIRDTGAKHVHLDVYCPSETTGPVNCTNSKQVQSLRKLDDSIEVVAMADGDLMAHRTWLKELVAPLLDDPQVGATFGNRWFMPETMGWGSLVRYIWNVAAVISMYFLKMPWGGCFAIRMSIIRDLDLVEKWAKVIAFDASTPRDLKRAGYQLQFVPTLMMPNYEECRLSYCHNFFQRQLTWTRLYHPAWPAIAAYSLVAGMAPIAAAAWVLVTSIWGLYGWSTAGLLIALLVNFLAQWGLFIMIQPRVEATIPDLRIARWMSVHRAIRLLLILPVTQAIQLSSLLAAIFCRRVSWRGITLAIHSPTDIRMVRRSSLKPAGATGTRESL